MAKKIINAKEPVRLRTKQLTNGSLSLYFDIYRNGKRSYEYLKMYLIPEKTEEDKRKNQTTLNAANKLKSERIIEMTNGVAGIRVEKDQPKIKLIDLLIQQRDNKQKRGNRCLGIINTIINLMPGFIDKDMTLDQVDKKFCLRFIEYLRTDYRGPKRKQLTECTTANYYRTLNAAFNYAVREELMKENPFSKLTANEKPKNPESKREYLTIEEVRTLIATPIQKYPSVKLAYLFACFSGLRVSDVMGLKWKNVFQDNGQSRLEVVMQKTQTPIYLPLSNEALRWMPEQSHKTPEDSVFDLPTFPTINDSIKQWAKKAGINKNVTFHTARHTFATMMLTLGADLYTTSKLLGHSDVRMTQVYAKIVNKKKDEAVNLVNGLFD